MATEIAPVGVHPMIGLSEQQYQEVMQVNACWPFPAEEDGWFQAHNAVRKEMQDLTSALESIVRRLHVGVPVAPWIVRNLQKWWPIFVDNVHHHHDNEEHIVFPALSKKATLPPKMSDDHVTLLQQMDAIGNTINALLPHAAILQALPVYSALLEDWQCFVAHMCEHLREEEVIAVPLLRKVFTHKTFEPVTKKLVAGSTIMAVGWLLHAMPSDAARRQWMTEVAGIPSLVQVLIMMPAVAKYERKVVRLLSDITHGQKAEKKPWFVFWA